MSSNTRLIRLVLGIGALLLVVAAMSGCRRPSPGANPSPTKVVKQSEGIPDSAWPASWFEAPKTASESGITEFQESPLLAERVTQGELPPLSERLPTDPIVIEGAKGIGKFGGTARVFLAGLNRMNTMQAPVVMDPQVSGILPNLAESWSFENGGKTFKLHLRAGLRWSDGHPFTSAAFVWRHKHMLKNKDLTPALLPRQQGLDVSAEGPLTVVFKYETPFAFVLEEMAHRGENFFVPGHFLKDYHPDFVDPEKLDETAKKAGYMNWMAYFNRARRDGFKDPIGTPTMRPYFIVKRSPTLVVFERNPYYPKVDKAGNQLPYIDRIQGYKTTSKEVMAAKASTGQVDFAASTLETQDIPLFRRGEKIYGYRTLIWNRLHGVDVIIQPNLTVERPKLQKLFRDRRFRLALSLAINRDEINEIVYFGQGTPRQVTVIPSSKYYEPEFAKAAIEYDPKKANELLDAVGMKDVDGDGKREFPDGSEFGVTLEWLDIETPKGATIELVVSHWRAVGVDISLKQVNNSLQSARARSNSMEMTIWHADRSTDILFPMLPSWFVPMYISWDDAHWSLWSHWYLSGGENGEKPTPEAHQLMKWWDEMRTSSDPERRVELGKRILRSQAENIWSIGTIGLAPQPMVVSDRLKNVCERGLWGWDNLWLLPYHPDTWYLDEGDK